MSGWLIAFAVFLIGVPTFNWFVGNPQNELAAGLWLLGAVVAMYFGLRDKNEN